MKQEYKQLLLVDLCARLSYGVKIYRALYGAITLNERNIESFRKGFDDMILPYLRPLSSMTEEEARDIAILHGNESKEILSIKVTDEYIDIILDDGVCGTITSTIWYDEIISSVECFDYLNKHMFDYRGLIPKGLAKIAPEGMYKHETKLDFNKNDTQIKVGCKIRSKTNPNVILSIISDDCHGDEFECSNGSVLSLKQIEKYYDLYIEENNGTIVIN